MNINKLSQEELTEKLVQGVVDVNLLDLKLASHKNAWGQAVTRRPHILNNVTPENAMRLILPVLTSSPKHFVYLKKEQYNHEFAQLYIASKFKNNEEKATDNQRITMLKSFDGGVLFDYFYTTPDDEEIYYFDNEFKVPSSIKSSIKVTIKLFDAVSLIRKLDVDVAQIGINKITSVITDLILNQYACHLTEYINENKLGYYSLYNSLNDIEEKFKERISKVFMPYGLAVNAFMIKKIAIPKDIQYKIEDQAFRIRLAQIQAEADNDLAKKSLANYETKLSIEQRYPNAEHSLTEYEKDLALNRYLTKVGMTEKEEINRDIEIQQVVEKQDKVVSKKTDVEPAVQPAPKSKIGVLLAIGIVCAVLSIVFFVVESLVSAVMFLTSAIVLILVFIIVKAKQAKNKPAPTVNTSAPAQPLPPATEEEPEAKDEN